MMVKRGKAGDGCLRVVMTGGGSGGHITPLLAVSHELRQMVPDAELTYIGQKGDSLGDIPAQEPSIDRVYAVRAGKLRRYHGEGLRQLLDIPTVAKNFRDVFYVVAGIFQSWRLLRKLRPDVVFIKGGFVGVPVGLAAAWLHIPFVTHDSDALPGLANRIIARWAGMHAVGLPKEIYKYPADKTVTVGVPISRHYRPLDAAGQLAVRRELGLQDYKQIVLVTGGGLGAQRLNEAILAASRTLLADYPGLAIVHLAGRRLEEGLRQQYAAQLLPEQLQRVQVKGFINNLYDYSAAADVVVTRAGGTSMAEFAAQAKACVVVPNPLLTGGHQLKNAQVLADRNAVVLVDESRLARQPDSLGRPLKQLLDAPERRAMLGKALSGLAQPDAAKRLAMLLLEQAKYTPAGKQ